MYYITAGPSGSFLDTGAGLDISLGQDDVIRLAAAETLDFGIELFGVPVGPRWGDHFGPANEVDNLSAVTVFEGFGI